MKSVLKFLPAATGQSWTVLIIARIFMSSIYLPRMSKVIQCPIQNLYVKGKKKKLS